MWTGAGILLCVLILVYLSIVARRAVDEEIGDGDPLTTREDSEERTVFLSPDPSNDLERGRAMAESPFRTHHLAPDRSLIPVDTEVEVEGRWS